jgi:hypothetical protein
MIQGWYEKDPERDADQEHPPTLAFHHADLSSSYSRLLFHAQPGAVLQAAIYARSLAIHLFQCPGSQ